MPVVERIGAIPKNDEMLGRPFAPVFVGFAPGLVPSRDAMLNLTFVLRPNNWDLASELLLNISTHGHPQRHKCAT